jgi:hypothetical protein
MEGGRGTWCKYRHWFSWAKVGGRDNYVGAYLFAREVTSFDMEICTKIERFFLWELESLSLG